MVEETQREEELDDLLDDVLNEFDSTTSKKKTKKKEEIVVSAELEDEMSKLVDSLNLQNENEKKNVYENIQELLHKQKEGEEEEELLPGDLIKEDDLNGLIDSMMSQLLSKDVLYEPLKELSIKYPQYIKGNDTYRKQYEITLKLVKIFESSNSEEKDSGRVQELLEELQALGPPPAELMDSMVPSGGDNKDSNSQESLDSLLASAQEDMPPECKQM